jgi:hypothetical protein
MFEEIANADLTENDIPMSNAEWHDIVEFALTFDGYSYWGSFEKCAEIANQAAEAYARQQVLPDSLTELRTCLFFEQRRYHHFGQSPDGQAMDYIHALVDGIRQKVRAKEIE